MAKSELHRLVGQQHPSLIAGSSLLYPLHSVQVVTGFLDLDTAATMCHPKTFKACDDTSGVQSC